MNINTINSNIIIITDDIYNAIINDRLLLSKYNLVDTLYFDCGITIIPEKFMFQNKIIKKIYLPNSITEICNNAFNGCSNLEYIRLSSKLIKIGNNAFAHCTSLKIIIIPDSTKYIGQMCFYNCAALTYIKLSRQIQYIPQYCFSRTKQLSSLYTIATSIGAYAFEKSAITQYTFNNVSSIAEFAFESCTKLISVYIPASIKYLGEGCFHRCNNITDAVISADISTICNSSFNKCSLLSNVIILNDNINHIQTDAFTDCPKLSSINFTSKNMIFDKYSTDFC